jgi:hypothetical protein
VTDLYDQGDEVAEVVFEICPVCYEPWRDITHEVFWREAPNDGGVVKYVLGCTREKP